MKGRSEVPPHWPKRTYGQGQEDPGAKREGKLSGCQTQSLEERKYQDRRYPDDDDGIESGPRIREGSGNQDLTYMFIRNMIALLARLRRSGGMRGFANRSISLS